MPILKSKVKEAHVVVAMNDVVKHHLGGNYESEGWFATERYIESSADVITRTLRGYYRAVKYCQEHRDEAAQIAGKEWSIDPAIIRVTIDEILPGFSVNGVPNEKGIEVGSSRSSRWGRSRRCRAWTACSTAASCPSSCK